MRNLATNREESETTESETTESDDVFRIDERTRETGRRGLAAARATLAARAAGERHAAA